MKIGVKESGPGDKVILAGTRALANSRALVGIPEAKSTRRGKGRINNAELLFIHSNGSPVRGIPKRMVIEPAIAADGNRQPIEAYLGKAAGAALDGNRDQMVRNLDLAGQRGESASKAWFTDPRNGWPPDKDATIRRKLNKLRGRRKKEAMAALAAGMAGTVNTTLIDSDQMRRAITHVVES